MRFEASKYKTGSGKEEGTTPKEENKTENVNLNAREPISLENLRIFKGLKETKGSKRSKIGEIC